MSYKLLKNQFGEIDSTTILRKTDNAFIPMIINAIKELSAKNNALETRLAALESA